MLVGDVVILGGVSEGGVGDIVLGEKGVREVDIN